MIRHHLPAVASICAATIVGFGGSATAHSRAAAPPIVTHVPINYLIALDVSGSMSYNIHGDGTLDGVDVRCKQEGHFTNLPLVDTCSGGVSSAWREPTERRIYTAKQMLNTLIELKAPEDSMRIVAFSGDIGYSGNVAVLPANGWSSDTATLRDAVLHAGEVGGDPYRTQGGSANAQGIAALAAVADAAPAEVNARTVVIIIADGPASIFLDGTPNTAEDSCPYLTPGQAETTSYCHLGVTEDGTPRPITAMIQAAQAFQQSHPNIQIFAIDASDHNTESLVRVASSPSMVYTSEQPTYTIEQIRLQTSYGIQPGSSATADRSR